MRGDFLSNPTPHPLLGNGLRGRGSLGVTAGAAAALGALAGCGGGTTASSATGAENAAPVALTIGGNVNGVAGSPIVPIDLSYGYFNDTDDDPLTFNVAGLEGTGLSFDGGRRISGTIQNPRTLLFTVTASDGEGGTASRIITLTAEAGVEGTAARPTFVSDDLVYGRDVAAGEDITPIDVTAGFDDPDTDGDDLTFSVAGLEGTGLRFDAASGMITGEFSGTENVIAVVTVTNGDDEDATSVEHQIFLSVDALDAPGGGGAPGGGAIGDDSSPGESDDERAATLGGLFSYQPAAAVRSPDANVIYAATLSNGESLESVGLRIDEQTGLISGVFTGSREIDPEDRVATAFDMVEFVSATESPENSEGPSGARRSFASIPLENQHGTDEHTPMDGSGGTGGGENSNERAPAGLVAEEDLSGSRGMFDEIEVEIVAIDTESEDETVIQSTSIAFDIEGNPQKSIGRLRDDHHALHGEDVNISVAEGFEGDFPEDAVLTYWAMGQDPWARHYHGDEAWRFHLNQIGIGIDPETGVISGEYDAYRDFIVYVTASDGNQFVTKEFEIVKRPVFVPPGVEIPMGEFGGPDWFTNRELTDLLPNGSGHIPYGDIAWFDTFYFAFSGPNSGYPLVYSARGLEGTGLEIDPDTGRVSGILESTQDVEFTVIVSRLNGAHSEGTLTIPVTRPPVDGERPLPDVFWVGANSGGLQIDFETAFIDPDGDPLDFSVEAGPDALYDADSNTFNLDASTGLPGVLTDLSIHVTNQVGYTESRNLPVEFRAAPEIAEPNLPSELRMTHGLDGQSVDVSGYFRGSSPDLRLYHPDFIVERGDSDDGGPLRFSATGLDETGLIMSEDGMILGRPLTMDETVTVMVTATDELGESTTRSMELRIVDGTDSPSWDAWALAETGGDFSFDASRYVSFVRDLDGDSLAYSAVLADGDQIGEIGLSVSAETGAITGTYSGDGTETIEVTASGGETSFEVDIRVRTDPHEIDVSSLVTVPVPAPDDTNAMINLADHFLSPHDGTPEWISARVRGDAAASLEFDPDTGMISGNFDGDRDIYVLARLNGEYHANILNVGPRFNEDRLDTGIFSVGTFTSVDLGAMFRNPAGRELDLFVSGHEDTGLEFAKHAGGGTLQGVLGYYYLRRLDDFLDEEPDSIELTVTDMGGDVPFVRTVNFDINWSPVENESGLPSEVIGVPGEPLDAIDLGSAFRDPDGDPLSYEIITMNFPAAQDPDSGGSTSPPGVVHDPLEGEINGVFPSRIPDAPDPEIIVMVTDGRGGVLRKRIVLREREDSDDDGGATTNQDPDSREAISVESIDASVTLEAFIVDDNVSWSEDELNSPGDEGGVSVFDAFETDHQGVNSSIEGGPDGDYLSSSFI